MKKHEMKQGEDVCIHCHGTSSSPIECVERPPTQKDIAEFSKNIPTIPTEWHESECECQSCLYNRRIN